MVKKIVTNSAANYVDTVVKAFKTEEMGQKAIGSAVQTVAYGCLCLHAEKRADGDKTLPSWDAISTSIEASNVFTSICVAMFIGDRPKKVGKVVDGTHDRIVKRWQAHRASIVNGIKLAIVLHSAGVSERMFINTGSYPVFHVPIGMIRPIGTEPYGKVAKLSTVALDGESYGFTDKEDRTAFIRATVEQVKSIHNAKVEAARISDNLRDRTTTDDKGNTNVVPLQVPVAKRRGANANKPSNQTTDQTDKTPVTPSFYKYVTEAARILESDKDASPSYLEDFKPEERNALAVLSHFYLAMVERTNQRDAANKAKASQGSKVIKGKIVAA